MAATATPEVTGFSPGERDVIIRQAPTRRQVRSVWGLSGGGTLINARAESLMATPAFRPLVPRRRRIIPATSFEEFTGRGRNRRALAIHRADDLPMALAGLWTSWHDPRTGVEHLSHVVITTSANVLMHQFKHRVPVILLDRPAIDRWLDPTITDPSQVVPLLGPAPDDLLVATPLATVTPSGQRNDLQPALPMDGV